jgi:hypothetical protein
MSGFACNEKSILNSQHAVVLPLEMWSAVVPRAYVMVKSCDRMTQENSYWLRIRIEGIPVMFLNDKKQTSRHILDNPQRQISKIVTSTIRACPCFYPH